MSRCTQEDNLAHATTHKVCRDNIAREMQRRMSDTIRLPIERLDILAVRVRGIPADRRACLGRVVDGVHDGHPQAGNDAHQVNPVDTLGLRVRVLRCARQEAVCAAA